MDKNNNKIIATEVVSYSLTSVTSEIFQILGIADSTISAPVFTTTSLATLGTCISKCMFTFVIKERMSVNTVIFYGTAKLQLRSAEKKIIIRNRQCSFWQLILIFETWGRTQATRIATEKPT